MTKNIKQIKKEMLEEFRNNTYGKNDALFDRSGNNVSRQVEDFLLQLIDTTIKQTLEGVEKNLKRYKNDEYKTDNMVILTKRWNKLVKEIRKGVK